MLHPDLGIQLTASCSAPSQGLVPGIHRQVIFTGLRLVRHAPLFADAHRPPFHSPPLASNSNPKSVSQKHDLRGARERYRAKY